MNEQRTHDCERFEAMMASWFDDDALTSSDREALTAHMVGCASCRESFELSAHMEQALVSRSAQIPAVDAFLPTLEPSRPALAHPRLVAVFRAMMSPTGIAIILVMWTAMLGFQFRASIASVFAWLTSERFSSLLGGVSQTLVVAVGGDAYMLVAIYVAVALAVLASTGAITLRYIRHS